MDASACVLDGNRVLKMSNIEFSGRFEGREQDMSPVNEKLAINEDLLMERILENINTTPIGQVLKKIASQPEIRGRKVLDVRTKLTSGAYEVNNRLDVALDKVLEELMG